ncbi:DNA damage-induced apoptosis suppressor protein [Parambassis ranga]|uniref:DNA damage-induced apoptosis suppressor protein n=1 Tax=Parambassis ranga TaxID=210632 RepID=A0A6P7IBP4_9TELE|nr:DNA damage-induced apoptosis suppressor protein [Parambassis ranga]
MSVGRALVDCAVLSLQDSCVFYPCCKRCYSRIEVEQQNTTRCRCSKCGFTCLREQVDYRYRLSLRVARDTYIFGLTVFGNSLNPFFGIRASGLHRLVENLDGPVGPSTRLTLLDRAVKDCFIGRHFIFGIKVLETESRPWVGGPALNGSNSSVQLVASQMILPKAMGLGGCTVLSYYHTLLQKVSENELGSANQSTTSNHPAATLLLTLGQSPNSSFGDAKLSASGPLCQSLQRLQHKDCTLTPTPPWQQSLGVITSSAEQEEDCSTQDSADESSRQIDNSTPPHSAHQDRQGNHRVTEARTSILSLEHSFYNDSPFAKYPTSSVKKCFGNIPSQNTWFSPPQPGHNGSNLDMKEFSASQMARTFLSNSLAWDDLPFSESLTEVLSGENNNLDIVSKTETTPNAPYKKDKAGNNVEITNLTTESASQRNSLITTSHSHVLLDICNKLSANGSDRPSGARDSCYSESNQKDKEDVSLFFEKEKEEQAHEDTYNCSADLFSASYKIGMNTHMLNMHEDTVSMITEARPLFFSPQEQHLRNENTDVTLSTPNRLTSSEGNNKDSSVPQGFFDFVPPSQSTPIAKLGVVSSALLNNKQTGELSSKPGSQESKGFHGNLYELDNEKPNKGISSLCKLNTNLVRHMLSSRCSHRLKPERRLRKLDKCKNHLQTQQHQRSSQIGAPNPQSAGSFRVFDVTVHDFKNNEVPPTPVNKMQLSVRLRREGLTDNSRSSSDMSTTQMVDGVKCKRTLWRQSLIQTGNCDSETVGESGSNDYIDDDENKTCNCSKDLFSDSV